MNFSELVQQRESCRNYADKSVETDLLLKVADTARWAPSASNSQPWNFYIVNKPELVNKVREAVMPDGRNAFCAAVPAFIVMTKSGPPVQAAPEKPYFHRYNDFDCGLVSSHLTLAATELGLSSCMLGIFQDELLKALCNYPDSETPVLVIAVGYAADGALREKKRRSLDEVAKVL